MDPDSALFVELVALTPLDRSGRPEEMVVVVLFLASDAASFIMDINLGVYEVFREVGAMLRCGRIVRLRPDEPYTCLTCCFTCRIEIRVIAWSELGHCSREKMTDA